MSANVAQTFAGFAARGQPGFGVPPWTRDQPLYLRIDKVGQDLRVMGRSLDNV